MKQLVCTEPGKLAFREVERPRPEKGQALLRIRRIGICGTDLHAYEGTQPFFSYPRVLGHELSAELVEYNGSGDFKTGQQVSFIPYFHCDDCIACRNGKPNCCVKMQVCGVHVDGGMSEYLAVPETALLDGEGLSLEELALVEPFAIGAHGVRRAGISKGEKVLVVGAGPIGLATMELARVAGGEVIAMDTNDHRLQFCREKLQIQHTINPLSPDSMEKLKAVTNGDMPTVVIDATGSRAAINAGFNYMAHGGRYVLIGLQLGEIGFSHPEFHKREGTLMSSRNATQEDFAQVMNAIRNKQFNPSIYISQQLPFEKAIEGFPHWLDPKSGIIKAMLAIS